MRRAIRFWGRRLVLARRRVWMRLERRFSYSFWGCSGFSRRVCSLINCKFAGVLPEHSIWDSLMRSLRVLSAEALQRCFDWTVGCGSHYWCAQSCLHNMRLSTGVADCLRVHLARRRGRARLWLSPLSAFVYSLVSLSPRRCRHVDTCTRSDFSFGLSVVPSSRFRCFVCS